ncbi:hydratase [Bradyrhizobium guangzhouense]|uniref:hydratase n=2 Tax=Bradyrhizobium guangzhouense TaxID=1325095 RepID=UPI001FE1808E|nr:hydratase [Bradyrhizobium guangzhouense]
MIAFVGSVFSPYYALARRVGRGDPLNHCALNVALYGERRKHWAMTERGRNAIGRTKREFVIGPSSVDWDGDALTFRIDEVAAPFPHRLRGVVRAYPSALTSDAFALDAAGRHCWHPIAPCSRVQVDFQNPAIRWLGDGYFDMNYGAVPLELEFRNWEWSRAALRRETIISYDTVGRNQDGSSLALRFDRKGKVEQLEPLPRATLRPTGWRVPRTARGDAQQIATVARTLEDAPFYARSQLSATLLGETVDMMHESLSLDRFRMPIVQAMLPFRMPRRLT